jgi:RNA-directed DNA polymerase
MSAGPCSGVSLVGPCGVWGVARAQGLVRNRRDPSAVDPDRRLVLPGFGKNPNYFGTGDAATKFRQVDRYVVGRLRTLLVKKRGRNRRPGQTRLWTEDWFNGQGLCRVRGTVRYPRTA